MVEYEVEPTYGGKGGFKVIPWRGRLLPERFTARVSRGDIVGVVKMGLRVDPVRGPLVEWYSHEAPRGGHLVAAEQRLPLGRLRDAAVVKVTLTVTGAVIPVQLGGPVSPPTRRTLDDEFLREVARVHAAGGRRGTAAVMDAFGVARATASRWVAEARLRLPPELRPPRRRRRLRPNGTHQP